MAACDCVGVKVCLVSRRVHMIGSFFDGVGVRDTRMILCLWYTIAYFRYGGNGVLENLILLMKNAKGGILKN